MNLPELRTVAGVVAGVLVWGLMLGYLYRSLVL